MKRLSTIILRIAILFLAFIIIALCVSSVWLKLTDDPNSIYNYLYYIFMAGVFSSAIPFFIVLYHAFRLLNNIDSGNIFSDLSIDSLKFIIYCAGIIFVICTAGGLPFFYHMAQLDDAPGLMVIGFIISGSSFVITVFAFILKFLLQEVIVIKEENDFIIKKEKSKNFI